MPVNGAERGGHRDAGDVIASEESTVTYLGHGIVAAIERHRVWNHDSTLRFGISGPHLIVDCIDVWVQRRHQYGVADTIDDVIQRRSLMGVTEHGVLGFHVLPCERCHREDSHKEYFFSHNINVLKIRHKTNPAPPKTAAQRVMI